MDNEVKEMVAVSMIFLMLTMLFYGGLFLGACLIVKWVLF